jgi:hypothetical protein
MGKFWVAVVSPVGDNSPLSGGVGPAVPALAWTHTSSLFPLGKWAAFKAVSILLLKLCGALLLIHLMLSNYSNPPSPWFHV